MSLPFKAYERIREVILAPGRSYEGSQERLGAPTTRFLLVVRVSNKGAGLSGVKRSGVYGRSGRVNRGGGVERGEVRRRGGENLPSTLSRGCVRIAHQLCLHSGTAPPRTLSGER